MGLGLSQIRGGARKKRHPVCAQERVEMFESNTANERMTKHMKLAQKTESAHIILCQVVDRLTPNGKYQKKGNLTGEKSTSSKSTKTETDPAHLLLCIMVDNITPNNRYVASKPLHCSQEAFRPQHNAHFLKKSTISAPNYSLIFDRPMRKDPPPYLGIL